MPTVLESALATPVLWPVQHGKLGNLQSRLLDQNDVAAVIRLRDEVLAGLDNPDMYVREDDENGFVRTHIGSGDDDCYGRTIGVFDQNRLVAYAMLGLPTADDPDNLGHFFSPSLVSPERTAHLTSCMVLEPYRGRHLQRMLLVARVALAQAYGRDFCVAMVSLHNHASRHNLLREGLRIGWVGEIDGLRRQLMAVRPGQDWAFDRRTLRLVSGLDWRRQGQLTRQGWWGINVHQQGQTRKNLVFARLAEL